MKFLILGKLDNEITKFEPNARRLKQFQTFKSLKMFSKSDAKTGNGFRKMLKLI